MGAIISYRTLSPFQGWGFYWAIFPGRCPGLSHFALSGQMQAYRKDFPAPELAERALSEPHIYSVADASGSECSVFLPCLCFCLFRFFPCSSVANLLFLLGLPSVAMLLLSCPTVADASGSERRELFP